ncbi:cysteine hydrolase family protein [Acidobacteriota bacterium]
MRGLKRAFVIPTLMVMLLSAFSIASAGQKEDGTALLLIDIQNFYFPGGMLPLENPEDASLNARKILDKFREKGDLVVHIRHNAQSGADIHNSVSPVEGEKVISKNYANAFKDTDLLEFLKLNKIKHLVIVGMQTHMCLEAATRAARDYDFDCTVIADACTTRDLKHGDTIIKAQDVHLSTLSSLNGTYAEVMTTEEFLDTF